MDVHVSPHPESPSQLPAHPIPLSCPRAPALRALPHASNLHWSFILHMLIYMFQCYPLKSFHPRLLPRSPKDCSLHLCLLLPCTEDRHSDQFSSVQSLSRVRLLATPWIAACQASLSITNSQSLLKLVLIELVMPSSHLILCRPLLLLPPIPPSIRVFSNESTLRIRWPKYWSFSFRISPSSEHWSPSGLISFRMDWLDLLAVQGTLKSLLQYHSSKASILQCSAFFIVQPSHPNMTIGKTIALTKWTFVSKAMSLLFNMPSRFGRAFLPRNKHLLVSQLKSPSVVI